MVRAHVGPQREAERLPFFDSKMALSNQFFGRIYKRQVILILELNRYTTRVLNNL